MTTDRVEREVFIQAPPARVWAALTEAEHLGTWFGDAGADVDLREGGAITVRWQKHGTTHAVIERLEPPRAFAYRWALRPDVAPREGNSTLVEFTLHEEAGGTRLRVVESGFASLEWPADERDADVRANVAGWAAELGELVRYLERQAA